MLRLDSIGASVEAHSVKVHRLQENCLGNTVFCRIVTTGAHILVPLRYERLDEGLQRCKLLGLIRLHAASNDFVAPCDRAENHAAASLRVARKRVCNSIPAKACMRATVSDGDSPQEPWRERHHSGDGVLQQEAGHTQLGSGPRRCTHHKVCSAQRYDAAEAHVRVVHAACQDQAVQQRDRDAHTHPALHAPSQRSDRGATATAAICLTLHYLQALMRAFASRATWPECDSQRNTPRRQRNSCLLRMMHRRSMG